MSALPVALVTGATNALISSPSDPLANKMPTERPSSVAFIVF
jgi:hypothetical protein